MAKIDPREKLEKIGRALAAKFEKIFLGAMGLMLAAVGYLYMTETSAPTPEVVSPTPTDPEIKIRVPKDAADQLGWTYSGVLDMATQRPEIAQTPYDRIIRFNPFDPKEVRDNDALKEQAGQIINQARQLRDQGNLPQALEEVNKALELLPKYQPGIQLRMEIEAKIAEEKAKAEAAAKVPKPPGPAGTPGS
jgi:tetratricopeptide (TPR) repeat protein